MTLLLSIMVSLLWALGGAVVAPSSGASVTNAPQESVQPAIESVEESDQERMAPPRRFGSASELLTALETADKDIRTFTATIRYIRLFEVQGDIQTRLGELSFKTDPPTDIEPDFVVPQQPQPVRKRSVAVKFHTFIAGDRQDKEERVWIFDGEWLVEKNPAERQFIKRRMVRPGQVFDPLRVGEGPFFVPVGQRRNDMESYFHTALRDSDEGLSDEFDPDRDALFKALARKLDGLIQLELRPRAGIKQVEDFEIIRVWYDPQTLLPRASLSVDPLGDIDIFELFSIDINEKTSPLAADAFSVKIPGPEDGYHVEVMDRTMP